MWVRGKQQISEPQDLNEEFSKIVGDIDDEEEARITLAKFLRNNLSFTVELLTGIKLLPFQEIILRAWFNCNYNVLIACRGSGKSFLAAIYCMLKCIFEPNTKILIASSNFRTSRRIFAEIERISELEGATLLAQCFGKSQKRNDLFEWVINGGSISAIPLSGERIRGIRANVLVVDEFLLLPQVIIETVLVPFLASPRDLPERIKIRAMEDDAIAEGRLDPKDRHVFKSDSQVLALSSASYTFDYLYQVYCNALEQINTEPPSSTDTTEKNYTTYSVVQLSYEVLPDFLIDKSALEIAKAGSQQALDREWKGKFVDGGDAYFSPKKMNECTIPDGQYPTTEIIGDPNAEYILAIDPNNSSSKTADFFAMSLFKLDKERKIGTLVHSYQRAGAETKDHIFYMSYLFQYFNIVFGAIDSSGADVFFSACNASEEFKKINKKIGFFDFRSELDGEDYIKELNEVRNRYNKSEGKIFFKMVFSSASLLFKANEHLQTCLNQKNIQFASKATMFEEVFEAALTANVPMNLIYPAGLKERIANKGNENLKLSIRDHIDDQDWLIKDTKDQCALIDCRTEGGRHTFDLPPELRKLKGENRPRKDNYSTLFMGNWAVKQYFSMIAEKVQKYQGFTPFWLN